MASILCLAHYCDTHGPTPLMVTEGLPVGCTSCFEDQGVSRRPSSSRSLNPADGLPAMARSAMFRDRSNASEEAGDSTAVLSPISPSAIETPPESPRLVARQQGPASSRRNSSFGKTYDENDKKRSAPCDNCRLTLPKPTKEGPAMNRIDSSAPILRTRKPYERVTMPSPPTSSSSQSSDSDNAVSSKSPTRRARSRTLVRAATSSSDSSFSITSHEHYLDYTSTHEPLAPTSFSIIRQSCLRTLSCETLPPSPPTPIAPSPSSPLVHGPFSPGPSSATSTSGGPIFFGDPLAGYTTAYVFRIPDPNARGRRRVYALMSLSTHRERAAMQSFSFLSDAFRKIAAWIQGLAESELERAEASITSPRWSNVDGPSHYSTPTSSFLSGRNRGPDGKYAGMSLRARGLAELVGMPDFFLELHTVFVKLLIELNVILGL